MAEDNTLINIGELAKPATVLIEKISDAIGGAFKPFQIKRVARAEAEAEKIKAAAQIEIDELQRRALLRFVAEETKKQDNIESITKKALPQLKDDSKPQDIENDWIANFFDKCRLVSDEDMQSIWAKILAGEANSPGKYSKRTVTFLEALDKKDAALFTNLCGYGFGTSPKLYPVIFNVNDPIYSRNGIDFTALQHLDNIGLLSFNPIAGYHIGKIGKVSPFSYYEDVINFIFPKDTDNELNIGSIILSQIGQELSAICGSRKVDGFLDYAMEQWRKESIIVSRSLPAVRISPIT